MALAARYGIGYAADVLASIDDYYEDDTKYKALVGRRREWSAVVETARDLARETTERAAER